MVQIFLGLGLLSMVSLGLAIPVSQFQEPWNEFFPPGQSYDTPSNRPYGSYAVQVPPQLPPQHPYNPQPYYGPPPPQGPPNPYIPGTLEGPVHPPEEQLEAPPPDYGHPNYGPTYGPPPPTVNGPPIPPYAPPPRVDRAPPPRAGPASPPTKVVEGTAAREAPQKQKPKLSLKGKLNAAEGAGKQATGAPPVKEKMGAQPKKPAGSTEEKSKEENSMRYHVNVGGVQKGPGGGTTNFHVYTDENGTKKFSDELDPDTEKYITEHMIPKLGNKKKKGGPARIWSVFGEK